MFFFFLLGLLCFFSFIQQFDLFYFCASLPAAAKHTHNVKEFKVLCKKSWEID